MPDNQTIVVGIRLTAAEIKELDVFEKGKPSPKLMKDAIS